MTALPALPAHLRTEVAQWTAWCKSRGVGPTTATPEQAEAWVGSMAGQTHAVRLSAINAISEWHRKHLGRPSPFAANPHPYPLLTRYIPWSFAQAWGWVGDQPNPQRQWYTLALVGRADTADVVVGPTGFGEGWFEVGGRVVPTTAPVVETLQGYQPPRHKAQIRVGLPPGVKLTDLHAALFVELQRRNVPETTLASVYGRWSAMRFAVADRPMGWFRGPAVPCPHGS